MSEEGTMCPHLGIGHLDVCTETIKIWEIESQEWYKSQRSLV